MPFLRLSRDRRGFESTFLLHAPHPGERPRVLYWYRTAPGVRVGRPALDEDAIRTIEEQHPEIEFDWAQILEVGAATLVEAEQAPLRRKKPLRPKADEAGADQPRGGPTEAAPIDALSEPAVAEAVADAAEDAMSEPPRAHDLLEELVGREIATRLHARYAELTARISRLPVDELTRDAWRTRAEAINPDNWVTPDEILSGVQRAGELFDHLRRELPSSP